MSTYEEKRPERYDDDACEPEPKRIGVYVMCSECGGDGRDSLYFDDQNCHQCNGIGVIAI